MDVYQQMKELRRQMALRQIADDGYFLSRQYQEDCQTMFELKTRLKCENRPHNG